MRLTHLLPLAVLPLLALAACDDDDDNGTRPQQQFANVRIVNAAAGTSNVEVLRTGVTTPLATLNFRGFSTQCIQVPAGSQQTLTFRSGGNTLATTTATFQANQNYTVILTGSGTTRTATVLSDQVTALANQNAIRFINASATAGDIFVTQPNAPLTGVSPSVANLGVFGTGGVTTATFGNFPTASTQIRFFNVGTATGTPRADFTLSGLPASRAGTVVLVDAGTPAGATAFLVTPCG